MAGDALHFAQTAALVQKFEDALLLFHGQRIHTSPMRHEPAPGLLPGGRFWTMKHSPAGARVL